jgi:hypothetical protein
MATPKQTAANRANAQESTGPRTTAGKSVSRFNALKHGIYAIHQIMFNEKPEDLAELAAEYHELYSPADSKERFLVDTLVHNEWRLRRTRRVEAELWQTASNAFLVKNIETTITCTSGDAFATDSAKWRWAIPCEPRIPKPSQPLPPPNPPPKPNHRNPPPEKWLRSVKIQTPRLPPRLPSHLPGAPPARTPRNPSPYDSRPPGNPLVSPHDTDDDSIRSLFENTPCHVSVTFVRSSSFA